MEGAELMRVPFPGMLPSQDLDVFINLKGV